MTFTLTRPGLDPAALQTGLAQHSTLQYLLKALGGSLVYAAELTVPQFAVTLDLALHQYTLLVIDDNPDAIDLFRRYLVGRPYEIVAAPESVTAIQIARESNPDVIILDVMLPGQDGLEVLQNLKNHPATSQIPVLVCSVLDTQDLALSLRADGYLRKPPGQAEFLNVLARWRA
jgi:CheY-like chemotaxis protein